MLDDGDDRDADVLACLFATTIGASLLMGAAWWQAPWYVIWFLVAVMLAPVTGLAMERIK